MVASETQQMLDRIAQLEGEVRRLSDREAIVDCLHRYSRGLDRLDEELLSSAYHLDAADHHGGFRGHPKEFVEWATNLLRGEWDISLHVLDVNHVDIEGDMAHSECYVLFSQRRRDNEGLDFGGARYIDRLERRNGEWRIAARQLIIDWTARAQTMVFADIPEYPSGRRDRTDPSYVRPFDVDLEER
jgi:hypothetical protein